jgi:GNAT superfamily N-acetyltransferase
MVDPRVAGVNTVAGVSSATVSAKTVIRPAKLSDLPSVVELIRALAEFESLPGPDAEAARRFAADFSATPPRFQLLIAEQYGKCVAYALYFFTYSTFLARPSLYLEDLFVRPDHRSLGIGRALLERLARTGVEAGCGRFEWTVLDWNERAQTFYRSLGARILPEWQVCRLEGEALLALGARATPTPAGQGERA